MKKLTPTLFLFTVIILEGYVVLSTELLAIRQTIPFVGSGTDTISIIIAAVLMPLAFGYYYGGRFVPGFRRNGRYLSVRKKLIFNIIVSLAILVVGMSYALLNVFFMFFINIDLDHRLFLTTLYSLMFLVVPVYLLGQTIPLVSNFFSREKLSQITGRMLFFSTVGSFMGAVFSTLVLMATIGVHYTAGLNFVLLAFLVSLLARKKMSETVILAYALAATGVFLNSGYVMRIFNIVENNQYNTVAVYVDDDGTRHLALNNNASSTYSPVDGHKHEYVEFLERIAIEPILESDPPKKIMVIGAGAFTFGLGDDNNRYDYVDIDKSLKKISEDHILQQKLGDNKKFHPMPARAFLTKVDTLYDVILLDAYLGGLTIPEHLVTKEFFEQVKSRLKPGGIVLANFITSPNFANKFSRHIDNTFRAVFPHVSRHATLEDYAPWNDSVYKNVNVIYIYRDHPGADADHLYTDNKNTIFYDKPQKRQGR